jgi:hypothetical protein
VRVDAGEVELAGNEEQYGAHRGEAGVAAGFAFGGLEEAVEGRVTDFNSSAWGMLPKKGRSKREP